MLDLISQASDYRLWKTLHDERANADIEHLGGHRVNNVPSALVTAARSCRSSASALSSFVRDLQDGRAGRRVVLLTLIICSFNPFPLNAKKGERGLHASPKEETCDLFKLGADFT